MQPKWTSERYLLTFRCSGLELAVDLAAVERVVRAESGLPEDLAAEASLLDERHIPRVHLPSDFGSVDEASSAIVLKIGEDAAWLPVDEVHGGRVVPENQVQTPSDERRFAEDVYVSGLVRQHGSSVIVLDAEILIYVARRSQGAHLG